MNEIITVFFIWIVINAFFPLFLNSIERQYQNQIDNVVGRVGKFLRKFFIKLIQLALIIFLFPNILVGMIAQNRQFKSFRMKAFFDPYVLMKDAILEKKFPNTFVTNFKIWRAKN